MDGSDNLVTRFLQFFNTKKKRKKFVKTRGEIIAAASTRSTTWVLGCYVIRDHPEIMLIMEPWGLDERIVKKST